MSKRKQNTKDAFDKGYRTLDNGSVISTRGTTRAISPGRNGYLKFNIRNNLGEHASIPVHYLVAYQKYGDAFFEEGINVRHKDGNYLNNTKSNILIGSPSQNYFDMPLDTRNRIAEAGACRTRKLTRDRVRQLRKDREKGYTYIQLAEKYNISKSAVAYIIKGVTYKDMK